MALAGSPSVAVAATELNVIPHQYLRKDLRRLTGARVKGPFSVPYCGNGRVKRCAAGLWAAIDRAARAEASRQGTSDPGRWTAPTVRITFTPLPIGDIQYTNRPSGIHQVMQFAP